MKVPLRRVVLGGVLLGLGGCGHVAESGPVAAPGDLVARDRAVAPSGAGAPEDVADRAPEPAPRAAPAPGAPRISALWGEAGEAWAPTSRLPDFSFAGYHAGEDPIPDVPVVASVLDFGARGDGVADDTAAIQAAIDAAEPGARLMPAGTYRISRPLRIGRSNLVLRGEGPGRTILEMVAPVPEDCSVYHENRCVPYGKTAMIDVVPPDFDNREPRGESRLAAVTAAAARGDTVLVLDSAGGIEPGQWLRLRMTNPADGSLGCHLYADAGCLNRQRSRWYGGRIVDWAVRVRGVDGDAVTLERPLRIDVRKAWAPELWSFAPPLEEVGLEGFTVRFPDQQYGGHHKEEGYYAIYFSAHQGWIRDVEILDADRAIELQSSYSTVSKVRLGTRFRSGAITGHYGVQLGGPWTQDNLVEHVVLTTDYVHNLGVSSFANGNVYASIEAIQGRLDQHGAAPYENLYTDIVLARGEQLHASGGQRRDEPSAGARSTFWNIRKRGGRWTNVGLGDRHPETNLVGIDLGESSRPAASAAEAWIEPWPGELTLPPNLYEAQLERRRRREAGEV